MKKREELLQSLNTELGMIQEGSINLDLTLTNNGGIILNAIDGTKFQLTQTQILDALIGLFTPEKTYKGDKPKGC